MFTNSPTRLHIRTVDTRLLDDHTAVLVTIAATTDKSQPRYDKLQTLVIVKPDHNWEIAALHNTAMSDQWRQYYQSR